MAMMRKVPAVHMLLATALVGALVVGCGGATHTGAGERWDGRVEETGQAADGATAGAAGETVQVEEETEPVATVPASPSELKGEHVEDVCYRLAKAGFTNIEPREDADLRVAMLHDEGDVSRVTIEGSSRFHDQDTYPSDARVVVEYHTFRNRQKRDISIEELKERVATWVADEQASRTGMTP